MSDPVRKCPHGIVRSQFECGMCDKREGFHARFVCKDCSANPCSCVLTPTNVVPITHAQKKRDYQTLRCGDGCQWAPPPAFSGTITHPITFPCPLCGAEYTIDANAPDAPC